MGVDYADTRQAIMQSERWFTLPSTLKKKAATGLIAKERISASFLRKSFPIISCGSIADFAWSTGGFPGKPPEAISIWT